MRALVIPLLWLALGACQCQPTAARYAVTRVTRAESANQVTTTTTQTFEYLDGRLFGGRELRSGTLSITSDPGGLDDHADYAFEYDDAGFLQRWATTSSNDALDSTVAFTYTEEDRIRTIESDSGNHLTELNIEATYRDDGRYDALIWEWGWWIFQSNERAVASYDDRGRIRDLDGSSNDIHYAWSDDELTQVDVVVENQDDLHYALGYDDQHRLATIDEGDDHWTLRYDDGGRLERIDVDSGGTQESVAYEYTDGNIQGVRIAPRLPLFVNFMFDTDGHTLHDLDVLALPDYF